MVTSGLMSGYEGGLFKPEGSITRWQFAKIAVNLHNIMHPDDPIEVVDVTTAPYADVPARPGVLLDESDWVAAAKMAGLVTATVGNNFQPYVVMRRDHMAAMMCRALGWEDEAAQLPAGTVGFSDIPSDSTLLVGRYLPEAAGDTAGLRGRDPAARGAPQAPARGRHPLQGARPGAVAVPLVQSDGRHVLSARCWLNS